MSSSMNVPEGIAPTPNSNAHIDPSHATLSNTTTSSSTMSLDHASAVTNSPFVSENMNNRIYLPEIASASQSSTSFETGDSPSAVIDPTPGATTFPTPDKQGGENFSNISNADINAESTESECETDNNGAATSKKHHESIFIDDDDDRDDAIFGLTLEWSEAIRYGRVEDELIEGYSLLEDLDPSYKTTVHVDHSDDFASFVETEDLAEVLDSTDERLYEEDVEDVPRGEGNLSAPVSKAMATVDPDFISHPPANGECPFLQLPSEVLLIIIGHVDPEKTTWGSLPLGLCSTFLWGFVRAGHLRLGLHELINSYDGPAHINGGTMLQNTIKQWLDSSNTVIKDIKKKAGYRGRLYVPGWDEFGGNEIPFLSIVPYKKYLSQAEVDLNHCWSDWKRNADWISRPWSSSPKHRDWYAEAMVAFRNRWHGMIDEEFDGSDHSLRLRYNSIFLYSHDKLISDKGDMYDIFTAWRFGIGFDSPSAWGLDTDSEMEIDSTADAGWSSGGDDDSGDEGSTDYGQETNQAWSDNDDGVAGGVTEVEEVHDGEQADQAWNEDGSDHIEEVTEVDEEYEGQQAVQHWSGNGDNNTELAAEVEEGPGGEQTQEDEVISVVSENDDDGPAFTQTWNTFQVHPFLGQAAWDTYQEPPWTPQFDGVVSGDCYVLGDRGRGADTGMRYTRYEERHACGGS